MQEIIKFDENYISDLKKKVLNFVSHNGMSINVATFNLTLFNKFTVNESEDTNVHMVLPHIENGKVTCASIDIDGGFFQSSNEEYIIDPDEEDLLCNKLTYYFLEGASLKFKTEGNKFVGIESFGITDLGSKYLGFHNALTSVLAEEINGYQIPDFDDDYSFNKQLVRMIIAIVGKKHVLNTYFGIDDSLKMVIYSLSSDNNLFPAINMCLTVIENLIDTLNSKQATIIDTEKNIINKLIRAKKNHLVNMIIDELYIPKINTLGLDDRKFVRDDILKGFLGFNYTNLKLNDENRESYYWASVINNTVPLNNIVSDQAHDYLKKEMIREEEEAMHDIYVISISYKAKNKIKEFFVEKESGRIVIKNNKKSIIDPKLVEEILSYAYINSIDEDTRKKLEDGILLLCSKNKVFKCTLKGNSLDNKCLVACIIELAKRGGYIIKNTTCSDTVAQFEVIKKEKDL